MSSPPLISVLVVGLLAPLVACKKEPFLPDAKADALEDAFQPPWWTPHPGEAGNWDIQLNAPFSTSTQRAMYVLPLFELTPATTLDYGDGAPVTVPAGALAGKVEQLHAAGSRVACFVGTGAIRLTDPDAVKFPGYEANPPDDPTPPAAGSVIGWHVSGSPNERYLDVRPAVRDAVLALIGKRFALAKQLGCDGVVMARNDRYTIDDGHGEVSLDDELDWHLATADAVHALEMGAGAFDSHLRGLSDELAKVGRYDFELVRRCAEFQECTFVRPFLNGQKAVFAIEFTPDGQGGGITPQQACPALQSDMIEDGIMKSDALDSSYVEQC